MIAVNCSIVFAVINHIKVDFVSTVEHLKTYILIEAIVKFVQTRSREGGEIRRKVRPI